jgi:hypothetical protein
MKKRFESWLLLAAVVVAGSFLASIAMRAQQPADQSVTRPDHIVTAGDLGACNEGDTEYNMISHLGKRCYGTGLWGSVFTLNNLLPDVNLSQNTSTGISPQRVCHVTYSFAVDGGATPIVPAGNCVIPANAVITNMGVQATTSVTAGGLATVAIGCVGGTACGSSSLMAATAKASLTAGTFGQSIPLPQTASTWVKTTASTGITLTIATGPLTAGILEVYVYFIVSSS